jgi:hypothetical protein
MRQFKYKIPQTDTRPLFYKDKGAYADSVLTANKDKEWVQRLIIKDRTSIPDPYDPKLKSTHLMADNGEGYVYPTVIKDNTGNLIHYPSSLKMNEDQAIEYAKQNNLGIQLPKEEGTWFANNGYKTGKIGQEYFSESKTPKWKTAKSPSQVKSGGVRLFKSQE